MNLHTVDSRLLGAGSIGANGETASEDVLPHVMRWAEAIDQFTAWMVVAGFAETTRGQYRYQLRRLAEAYPRRSPWRLRTADLVAWLSAQQWGHETRKSYHSTLRVFYRWGMRAGHTRRNPADALPTVRVPPAMPRPASLSATVVALATASDRDRLILSLAAYAGLRRGEIAALMWTDVEDDRLRVTGKGGKVRMIPLHEQVALELAAERERRDAGGFGTGYRYQTCTCGCVFPGQSGRPMTPNAVGKAASRALGDGWGAHSLRHQFATRVYAGSRDLLAVQTLLGHAKPETTRRYTQLSDDALSDAVNAI